jgi:AGCS family alanine or glycine:cation symporter
VERGVFTNEAGIGSAAIAHACSSAQSPDRQGLFGIFEVFFDTLVICTLTALTILTSGVSIHYGQAAGLFLTADALSRSLGGGVSAIILAVSVWLFASASVWTWGLYGARCAEFLFGSRSVRRYLWIFSAATVLGAFLRLELVWTLCEWSNALMALPNLLSLLLLGGVAKRIGQSEGKFRHMRHRSQAKNVTICPHKGG